MDDPAERDGEHRFRVRTRARWSSVESIDRCDSSLARTSCCPRSSPTRRHDD
jgi:hypothetical protein